MAPPKKQAVKQTEEPKVKEVKEEQVKQEEEKPQVQEEKEQQQVKEEVKAEEKAEPKEEKNEEETKKDHPLELNDFVKQNRKEEQKQRKAEKQQKAQERAQQKQQAQQTKQQKNTRPAITISKQQRNTVVVIRGLPRVSPHDVQVLIRGQINMNVQVQPRSNNVWLAIFQNERKAIQLCQKLNGQLCNQTHQILSVYISGRHNQQ